jgi:hypothetical protein
MDPMNQTSSRTPKRSRVLQPLCLLGAGLALSLVGGIAVAGAEETSTQQYTWNIVAEARGVSPYAEVPSEAPGGGPFVRAELESTNQIDPSAAFGALGYPSQTAQEGAFNIKSKPGDVYASSGGGSSLEKKARFAPFGAAGPYVAVEAPDALTAQGEGAFRVIEPQDVKADSGYSLAKTSFSKEVNAMVAESTTHAFGIKVGDTFRVGAFESWVRMTFRPDAEPTVDYRLALTGVHSGNTEAMGWSNQSESSGPSADSNNDIVISGKGIGAGKVAEDFAKQMSDHAEIPNLMKGGVFIHQPRVAQDGQYFKLAGAALELRYENLPRQGGFGQAMGIRFGDSVAQGYYLSR